MIETALYFLHKVAEELPNNQFAKAIFNRFNKAGQIREEELENSRLLNTPDDNTPLGDYNPAKIERGEKDFRFLHLYLKAFRKFPADKHYGLSFCDDEGSIPENTLLQGRNGTGKTSIFDAMEYLFTYNVSAANKMGFKSIDDLKDYLPYAGMNINDIDIGVKTRQNNFTFSPKKDDLPTDDVRQLCLKPFFCSEYDVDKLIANKNKSLDGPNNFIYEQMGYGLVMNIINKLDNEIKEATSFHTNLPGVSLEKTESLEEIESKLDDLDKDIRVFQDLQTYFIYLVVRLKSDQKLEPKLQKAKRILTKTLSINIIHDKSSQYEKEKDLIIDILGHNAFTKLYSELEESIGNEGKIINPTLQQSEKDRQYETLNRLLRFRRCLSIILEKLLTEIPNVEICNEKYDEFIKEKIDTKKTKEDQARFSRFADNEKTYNEFLTCLKNKVYGTIDYLTRDAREIINEVMQIFAMEDEEIDFEFDKKNGTFKMEITLLDTSGKPIGTFTPEKYLNTFRYKLYCMTLKMAIAFAMKRFYKINFPIVIDDIFYSSDFTHRSMVRAYFRILFKKHKDLFPEPQDELQVLFFSHDEVIIEAASRGIRDARANANQQMLFDYKDADTDNKLYVLTNDGQIIEIISLTCSL